MGFFLEVLIGGLLAGVLYSLVALGFVLIFKASGVFNFAQGAMVLTAALALVRTLDIAQKEWHWPFWLALVAGFLFAAVVMAIIAWASERLVLRKLVNQEGVSLLMATVLKLLAGLVSVMSPAPALKVVNPVTDNTPL